MYRHGVCLCLLSILEITSAQTPQSPASEPAASIKSQTLPIGGSPLQGTPIEPVVLTHSFFDDNVVRLGVAPRIATSIRMPETVTSVVVGDPDNFQAEHSEHEPELVTVKPITDDPAETNLLISTVSGRQLNVLIVSPGKQPGGTETVDVLLRYVKPASGSFLIEENSFATVLVPETQTLGKEIKAYELPGTTRSARSGESLRVTGLANSKANGDASAEVLDRLLTRQEQAPLPQLYGEHPGEIDPGPRVKAGVSEVLDEGKTVVVLFSVVNPSNHAIEVLPPQIQLGGKRKKKWTTAEQLYVFDFRLSRRRLGPAERADGVVVFERPAFKQSNETLFLQVAESGAVDLPALAPIGFGISSFRGGSAYEPR